MSLIKVKLEDIKLKLNNENGTVCQTCLSSDRVLSVLDDNLDIYTTICDPYNMLTKQIHVCWECNAVLKKMKLFQAQVKEAQRILNYQYSNKRKNKFIKSLSKLSKTDITYFDNTNSIIYNDDDETEYNTKDMSINIDNIEPKIEIKDEQLFNDINDIINDNYDIQDYDNDISNDNVFIKYDDVISNDDIDIKNDESKSEVTLNNDLNDTFSDSDFDLKSEPETRQELETIKKPKTKRVRSKPMHYIIVYGDVSEKSLLIKQIDFKPNEVTMLDKRKDKNKTKPVQCVYECMICQLQFPTVPKINTHLNEHAVIKCVYCEMILPDRSDSVTKHVKLKHKSFICDHCGKKCLSLKFIEKHMISDHMTHKCDICHKIVRNRDALHRHRNMHHLGMAEHCFCVPCGVQFANMSRYLSHLKTTKAHAKERDNANHTSHPCSICHKTFQSVSRLKRHKYLHKDQNNPEACFCAPCGKQFKSGFFYQRHVKYSVAHALDWNLPQNRKVVSCSKCDKKFSRTCNMMNHYRFVHENTSKHVCTICDRPFLNRTKLSNHIKYYHEKKEKIRNKFCDVCGKGFHSNTLLRIHMAIHTGVKPHKCELCTESFSLKGKLMEHIQNEH